ncbi:DUF1097 domain-containing protein [Methylomonas sp. SURF-2]|uniref:DUF1097 domain-containing protein n=1 Tax=Methylomonas subterranea TaxID=2952225 RepID=A0ABT1TC44_9GAMM|nr:DUF1097 domain-containing protein [Methylomonas sp. SURF-2]MCQ8103030.1 DUF1097 domain-containing protein [Methylomonas sp. SURF-2]
MDKLTALSTSIALLAGVMAFFAVGPASGLFLIWVSTIAWAAFFLLGADKAALTNILVCGSFGALMGWIGALIIANIAPDTALGVPLMAALAVIETVWVMCMAAHFPRFAAIPASVLGYSCVFGYLLQTPDTLAHDVLLGISPGNPLVLVCISIALGAYFGVWSAQFAAKLETVKIKK